jgi:uncharacterized protein
MRFAWEYAMSDLLHQVIAVSPAVFFTLMFTAAIAASVNGALGYGFSSVMVPVSLTMITSRLLNPALVLLEVVVNGVSLVMHRSYVRSVWPRVAPLLIGLLPGVVVGGIGFGLISAAVIKTGTYILLLPIIALQSFSWRWKITSERNVAPSFGFGLGVLYATTTVSGPPLALYFNNLGLAQHEFRAAMAIVRVIESIATLVMYALIGALSSQSAALSLSFLPVVLVCLAVGRWMIRNLQRDRFGALCMRIDAVLVTVGLATAIASNGWLPPSVAFIGAALFTAVLHTWAHTRSRRSTMAVSI